MKQTDKNVGKIEEESAPPNKQPSQPTAQSPTQPSLNIGMVGHVDNGKTTLVSALTGKWTDTHSEEMRRGITIRLGYADATFCQCNTCKQYGLSKTCACGSAAQPMRKVSFVDAPGHESLMATMLSGAAIMDGALLLVASNEPCPQPQTREHLMALEMIGLKNIVLVQTKIDLVTPEQAAANYQQIKAFVKGTIAEHAPIIPISSQQKVNLHYLVQAIEETIPTPTRDAIKAPLLFIARSFDINKPGTAPEQLQGGVLGGALKQGMLTAGDEIEIRPGYAIEREGKKLYRPLKTKVVSLQTGGTAVERVSPGGSVGVLTELDPFYVKADSLTGNIAGKQESMPPVWESFTFRPKLLGRVVGTKEELKVEPIKLKEPLMLNVNSAATVGFVTDLKKSLVTVKLRVPVCCAKEDRLTISRMIGNRWRLIGTAEIVG